MNRIYNAIKKYLIKDTKYFFTYFLRNIQSEYKVICNFYSDDEIIEQFKLGKSFLRIGDGEIAIMHHLGIGYQEFNAKLRDEYLNSIKNYSDKSNYLIGLPLFVNLTNNELDELGLNKKRVWLPLKITFDAIFNKYVKYVDAHIFYKNNKFEKIILPIIKNKKVIIVTNERNINDISKHNFNNYVFKYISCPEKNSYDQRNTILYQIKETIENSEANKSDFLVLLSMGPSKIISVELSESNIQTIDIGMGIEGYIRNLEIENRI